MSLCNAPVSLESITKHADVSRWIAGVGPIGHSCLSDPAEMARRDKRRADVAARLTPCAAGLDLLVKLRTTWGNFKRAKRNAAEDRPYALATERRYGPGAAWEQGLAIGPPNKPRGDYSIHRVQEAVEAGLPPELADLCRRWLAQQA